MLGGGVQVNVGGVRNMLRGARMKLGGCAPPAPPPPRKSASAWNQSTSSVSIVSCFDFVLLLMSRQLPGATKMDIGAKCC